MSRHIRLQFTDTKMLTLDAMQIIHHQHDKSFALQLSDYLAVINNSL